MSRVNRFSLGSGVLDADTNDLGGETTRWWKNLEGNTLVQMSIGTNVLNQTSPQLNSNSEIESDNERAQWWKALEMTEEQFEPVAEKYIKLDRSKEYTTTSESEEEPRIVKKKYVLGSQVRKTQGNQFLNALNRSVTSLTSEPAYRSRDSANELSNDKAITDIEQAQKNSARRSENPIEILRLKQKGQLTVSKSRSLRRSLISNKADREFRNAIDSPIIKRGGMSQVLSYESDDDISQFPMPEAQSTLLDITTPSVQANSRNNSNTEVVRKPKPKFSKPENKDAKKNIFMDILAEEVDQDEEGKSKSVAKSSKLHVDVSKKSISPADCFLKIPKIILTKIDAPKKNVEVVRQSLNTDDSIIPSSQNVKKSIKHNKLNDSIESDSSSSTSRRFTRREKPRSRFFNKPYRVSKNIFQNAFEEDDADEEKMLNVKDVANEGDDGTPKTQTQDAIISQMNSSSNRSSAISVPDAATSKKIAVSLSRSIDEEQKRKESVFHREDEQEASKGHSRTSSSISRTFSTRLYSTDEDDDELMKRASSRNSSKSVEWSIRSSADTLERLTRSGKQSTISIFKSIQIAKDLNSLKPQKRHSIGSQRERATSENSGISIENTRTSGEREVSLPRSISAGFEGKESVLHEKDKLDVSKEREEASNNKYPWMCTVLSDSSHDESKHMEKMKNKSASKFRKKSKDIEVQENITTPKRRSRHSFISQKQRASRENNRISVADAKTSGQTTINTSRSVNEELKTKGSTLHEDDRDVSRKHSKTVRKSLARIYTAASSTSDEGDENMEEKKDRSVNKLQEPSLKEDIEVDKNISTRRRQNGRSTILQEQIASEEITKIPIENSRTSNRKTVNLSRSVNEERKKNGSILHEDDRDESRKHSNTPRKSFARMYSAASSSSDEKDENMEEKKNRSVSKLQDSLKEDIEVYKNISSRPRQSGHSTISQEQIASEEITKIPIENSRTSNRKTVNLSRSVNEERKKNGSILHEDDRDESRKHSNTPRKSFARMYSAASSSSDEKDENMEEKKNRSVSKLQDSLKEDIEVNKNISSRPRQSGHSTISQEQIASEEITKIPIENSRTSNRKTVNLSRSVNEERKKNGSILHEDDRDESRKHSNTPRKSFARMYSAASSSSDEEDENMEEMKNRSVSKLQDPIKEDIEVDKNISSRTRQSGHSTISQEQIASEEITKIPIENSRTSNRKTVNLSRSVNEERKKNGSILHEDDRDESRKHSNTPRKSFARMYSAASSSSDEEDENMEEMKNRSVSKLQDPIKEDIEVDKNISSRTRQSGHSTISQEQIAPEEITKIPIENSRTSNRKTVNSSRSVNEELKKKGSIFHDDDGGVSRKRDKTPRKSFTRILSAASSNFNEGDENMEEMENRSVNQLQEPSLKEGIEVDKNISSRTRQSRRSTISQEQIASEEMTKIPIENSRTSNRKTVNSSRSVNEELKKKGSIFHEDDDSVSRKRDKTPRKSFTRILSAASSNLNEGDENMEEMENRSVNQLQEPSLKEGIEVVKNVSTRKRQSRRSISQEQIASKEISKIPIENGRISNRKSVNSSRSVNEELKKKGSIFHDDDGGVSRKRDKTPRKSFARMYSAASSSSDEEGENMEEMKNRSVSKLQDPIKEDIEVDKNISSRTRQSGHSTISQEQIAPEEITKIPIENSRTSNRKTVNSSRSVNEELKKKGSIFHDDDGGVSRKRDKTPRKSFTRILSAASSSINEGDENREEMENRSVNQLQEPSLKEGIEVVKNVSTRKRQSRRSISQEQIASKEISKIPIENGRISNRRTVNSSRSVHEELKKKGNVLQEEERDVSKAETRLSSVLYSEFSTLANVPDDKHRESVISPVKVQEEWNDESKIQEMSAKNRKSVQPEETNNIPRRQTRQSTLLAKQLSSQKGKVISDLDKSKESSRDLNRPESISTATTVHQSIDEDPNVRETHSKILDEPGASTLPTKSITSRSKIVGKGQKSIHNFFSVGKMIPASQGFANAQKKEEVQQALVKIQKLDMVAFTASRIAARKKSPVRRTRRQLRPSARNRSTDQTQNRSTKANQKYKSHRLPRPKYWVTDRLYNYLWKRLEPKYSKNSKAVSEKFVVQLGEVTTLILRQKSYLKYKYAANGEREVGGVGGSRVRGKRGDRAWYDKTGPAEVINRGVRRSGAVFGRVTPLRAHRSDSSFGSWGCDSENRSPSQAVSPVSLRPSLGENFRTPGSSVASTSPCRYAEEVAEQVRTQTPQGDQEAVDAESQGEKVTKLDPVALDHPGHRVVLVLVLVLVVDAVAGHEKHRHVHDVRELGRVHLDVLLLSRARTESEEREHRERDDNLTDAATPWTFHVAMRSASFLRDRGTMKGTRIVGNRMLESRKVSRRLGDSPGNELMKDTGIERDLRGEFLRNSH